MTNYVVADGKLEIALLKGIFGKDLCGNIKYVDGGSEYGGMSLSMSILVEEDSRRGSGAKLVYIRNTHTRDSGEIANKKSELMHLFDSVCHEDYWKILIAVPEIESILFDDESGMREMFGDAFNDIVKTEAKYEPRKALEQLLSTIGRKYDVESILWMFTHLDHNLMMQNKLIKEIYAFLNTALAEVPAERC